MNLYKIDEYGRAVIDGDGLFELWMQGQHENDLVIVSDDAVARYNRECETHSKIEHLVSINDQPPVSHRVRANTWMIPDEFKAIDVEAYCVARCTTSDEIARVKHEMGLYRARRLEPLLQAFIHMIDVFRKNNIVWGIGRGSSVASYVLYLIGVHKINPMAHGLTIEEFLR